MYPPRLNFPGSKKFRKFLLRSLKIFIVRIRNCGNWTLSKAKSSIHHYQEITHMVSACFLLMRNTVPRTSSRKFYMKLAEP